MRDGQTPSKAERGGVSRTGVLSDDENAGHPGGLLSVEGIQLLQAGRKHGSR